MDDVGRRLGNPYLRLPRDVRKVLRHGSTGEKRGHEYEPSPSRSEEGFQLVVALDSNRTMTRDRFNQDKPVLLRKVHDHVGHFPMLVDFYPEPLKIASFNVPLLLASVAQVRNDAARCEARAEHLDYLLHELVLTACGQRQFLSAGKRHREQDHLTLLRLKPTERFSVPEEARQRGIPRG